MSHKHQTTYEAFTEAHDAMLDFWALLTEPLQRGFESNPWVMVAIAYVGLAGIVLMILLLA